MHPSSNDRYYAHLSDSDAGSTFVPSPLSPTPYSSTTALNPTYVPYNPDMDHQETGSLRTILQGDRSQEHLNPNKSATSLSKNQGAVKVENSYEMQPSRSPSPPLASAESKSAAVDSVNTDEDEIEYPTGAKLAVISIALSLAVFLMALDNTIIATAIPKITDQFNSLDDVGWYVSSYLLTTCSLQLFFGRLYTFYSIKWVFITSITIFEIGSAVCGSAPSSNALIAGRAIAGLGSAGLFSGALVIIAYTVPMAKRPAYTGIIGACYGIASVAGPLLGGAFTDGPGWGWCFYINLPLGALSLAVIFFFFKSPQRKAEASVPIMTRLKQLDIVGTVLFIVDVVVVLLALQWGGSKYAWNSWRIILLFTLFGVLTIIFIALQWYMKENATIPFYIISQRSVAAACSWAFTLGAAFFIFIYWVPIWFQAIKGVSALKSGIYCLPMILALVLANALTGAGTTVIGYYNPFYYVSVVLSCIGAGLLTTWQVDTSAGIWIGFQIIYGFGVGFGMQQSIITVQAVLPMKDIPCGTAMASFFQTFGGALFASAAQNVFNNRLIDSLPKYAAGVNPDIVLHVGATELRHTVAPNLLNGVLKAYNLALTQTWYIAVAMCCLTVIPAIFVEWKSVKGMKPGAVAA